MAVEPNRWGIIYNPKAGSRKTQKRWNEIRSYMENRKVVFDYVQSEGFGSVERLARTLANNGYRTIVIVGGDGAINDAINGIMTSMVEDKTNIGARVKGVFERKPIIRRFDLHTQAILAVGPLKS